MLESRAIILEFKVIRTKQLQSDALKYLNGHCDGLIIMSSDDRILFTTEKENRTDLQWSGTKIITSRSNKFFHFDADIIGDEHESDSETRNDSSGSESGAKIES